MATLLATDLVVEPVAQKKCAVCGSTDRVKTVKIVRKGGKRKVTVQKNLCIKCRKKGG